MVYALIGLLAVAFGWFVKAMSHATVELTEGGVYHRIYISIGSQSIAWRADLAIQANRPNIRSIQGPIVEHTSDGAYTVSWYCGAKKQRQEISDTKISLDCGDVNRRYYWQANPEPVKQAPASSNTLVISDLEGNLDYFLEWGQSVGVLDAHGNWALGEGQLVILGDSVDRGRRVFDLLWKLYELEIQAARAGGALHLLLGNHEQYVLQGQLSKVETEHLWATEQLMPYQSAYSENSVLGAWLRSKPIALILNKSLFVHGGISQQALDQNLSIDRWNELHRTALQASDFSEETLFGLRSFTQYRGYFYATSAYPKASQALIDATLRQYNVDQLVVGHTKVDSISTQLRTGLYAIETADKTDEYLQIIDGNPTVKRSGVIKRPFHDTNMAIRPFELKAGSDWKAFVGVFTTAIRSALTKF